MNALVEKNGLTYRREGDYYIPNIEIPENKPIGKYGLLRETFLNKNPPVKRGVFQFRAKP